MMITEFDVGAELIFVSGRIWGPLVPNGRRVRLVLDTGAAETIIIPDVIDAIGYSPSQGHSITTMRSAVGMEKGYLLRVARFATLGFQQERFSVHVQDLPSGWGIEGLIGLNFLRALNYEVRSIEGRILVDRAEL